MPPTRPTTRTHLSESLKRSVLVREWPRPHPESRDLLLLHGLGDHSAWHDWVAQLGGEAGYRVVGIDWPGNGGSDGVRGDMPTAVEAETLLEELLVALDLSPVGLFAHSAGGFLALRWLERRSHATPLKDLRWVWLSSPLLRPSHGQPRLKIALAAALARHFPRQTLSTGVRARKCFHTGGHPAAAEAERRRAGGHHRISLRFAADLIVHEAALCGQTREIREDLAFLLTQGSEDPVCPPPYAEELFHHLPGNRKTWLLASGARHEPHHEPENEGFLNAIRAWLQCEEKSVHGTD